MPRREFHINTSVTITHPPSGIRIEVISHRGERDLIHIKKLAIRVLRSKLYMRQHPEPGIEKVYDLPDDAPYPHDLIDYR